ncbi:methyltransferase domain-containing protein [Cellulophaga sp. BC115SP]|uniref:methyltransferase domain-containing protein n=1 Tax=Cellulophaga sp. BC115SP TaxID=2683263 RepID=UPI001411F25A|nr:methyltransferase domain-containing protein [Cellulophaga sp. BC115SP]NBB29455.1 methyltransferase domain-containing protein [Cellulophaga sp. BC115SP]
MKKSFEAYQLHTGDVIASIGAASGVWEIGLASMQSGLTFYIQDIDEYSCNEEEVAYAKAYWERQLGRAIDGTFYAILGTPQKTNLPKNTFDKVLIINAFHEFQYLEEMLHEVSQILKPVGKLIIEEEIALTQGQIHEGCGLPLFSETQLVDLLEANQFRLDKIVEKESYLKVFIFEKK